MANNIYVGQELILNFTDTDEKDMDVIGFRVDYWKPTNKTNTPDGTLDGGAIVTTPGSAVVVVTVPVGILDEPTKQGRMWRFQIIDVTSGIGWTPMTVDVKNLGTQPVRYTNV